MIVASFYAKCRQNREANQRDQELIELWKERWKKLGFVPLLIGIDKAVEHPDFQKMNMFALDMPTVNGHMFDWLCFVRWCSIAMASGECRHGCLFTDYDVFPTGRHGFPGLADRMNDATKGKELVNFDPGNGAGLMYGTESGFESVLQRILTYHPDGTEKHGDKPHISDMIVLQRHVHPMFPPVPNDLRVTTPDANDDLQWKTCAFVHFGGGSLRRQVTKCEEIKQRLGL